MNRIIRKTDYRNEIGPENVTTQDQVAAVDRANNRYGFAQYDKQRKRWVLFIDAAFVYTSQRLEDMINCPDFKNFTFYKIDL